jgi:hypothetical protein
MSTLTADLPVGDTPVAVVGGAWAHANDGTESEAAIIIR